MKSNLPQGNSEEHGPHCGKSFVSPHRLIMNQAYRNRRTTTSNDGAAARAT